MTPSSTTMPCEDQSVFTRQNAAPQLARASCAKAVATSAAAARCFFIVVLLKSYGNVIRRRREALGSVAVVRRTGVRGLRAVLRRRRSHAWPARHAWGRGPA